MQAQRNVRGRGTQRRPSPRLSAFSCLSGLCRLLLWSVSKVGPSGTMDSASKSARPAAAAARQAAAAAAQSRSIRPDSASASRWEQPPSYQGGAGRLNYLARIKQLRAVKEERLATIGKLEQEIENERARMRADDTATFGTSISVSVSYTHLTLPTKA